MVSIRLAKALLMGGAVMMFFGVAPACAPSIGAYCDKVCSCEGCAEAARQKCTDDLADTRDVAREKGCSGEFNTYLSCMSSEMTCSDGKAQPGDCKAEADAVTACAGSIGVGTRCQDLCDESVQCGGGTADCQASCAMVEKLNAAAGCTGLYDQILECISNQDSVCNLEPPCNELVQPYSDCISIFCSNNPGSVECGGGTGGAGGVEPGSSTSVSTGVGGASSGTGGAGGA